MRGHSGLPRTVHESDAGTRSPLDVFELAYTGGSTCWPAVSSERLADWLELELHGLLRVARDLVRNSGSGHQTWRCDALMHVGVVARRFGAQTVFFF